MLARAHQTPCVRRTSRLDDVFPTRNLFFILHDFYACRPSPPHDLTQVWTIKRSVRVTSVITHLSKTHLRCCSRTTAYFVVSRFSLFLSCCPYNSFHSFFFQLVKSFSDPDRTTAVLHVFGWKKLTTKVNMMRCDDGPPTHFVVSSFFAVYLFIYFMYNKAFARVTTMSKIRFSKRRSVGCLTKRIGFTRITE